MSEDSSKFRFKKFEVLHVRNGQKVSTDSVLLGAWADFSNDNFILDIGTGSGVLALMAAQRSLPDAKIYAVEIIPSFFEEAKLNFMNSGFAEKIEVIQEDIKKYEGRTFDHIICNPPYFKSELLPDSETKSAARHNLNLTFPQLAVASRRLLNPEGKLSIVIPYALLSEMKLAVELLKIFPYRITSICHREDLSPSLALIEFRKNKPTAIAESKLVIKNEEGYHPDYRRLLADFLTIF